MAKKRLIDANALTDKCRQICADDWNKRAAPCCWSDAYEGFIEDIEEAPTVDAVEVVHGRWIISGEEYRNQDVTCSACGDKRETYGWPRKQLEKDCQRKHYCPNCGAKMDEEG